MNAQNFLNQKVLLTISYYGDDRNKISTVINRGVADKCVQDFEKAKGLYRSIQIDEIEFAESYDDCMNKFKRLIPFSLDKINEEIDRVRNNIINKACQKGSLFLDDGDDILEGLDIFNIESQDGLWIDARVMDSRGTHGESGITINTIYQYSIHDRERALINSMANKVKYRRSSHEVILMNPEEIEGIDPFRMVDILSEDKNIDVSQYDGEKIRVRYRK